MRGQTSSWIRVQAPRRFQALRIANGFDMQQHPGKVYYSASGHQVVEKGSKVVKCAFQNGEREDLRFKIMSPDVRRGLASVSECVKAGNKVVFDKEHSFVYNYKNDSYKIIYLKDGVYVLPVRFESSDQSEHEGFQGQARL